MPQANTRRDAAGAAPSGAWSRAFWRGPFARAYDFIVAVMNAHAGPVRCLCQREKDERRHEREQQGRPLLNREMPRRWALRMHLLRFGFGFKEFIDHH